MRRPNIVLMAVMFIGVFVNGSFAQTGGIRLEPSGVELELYPGHKNVTGFLVKTDSMSALRDGVVLSLADWEVNRDDLVIYKEPGSVKHSASAWITIHPTTLPMAPGNAKIVRITVQVPEDAAPGLYTSAILVEEKTPTATTPAATATTSKLFQAFTVYVTVRPPAQRGSELSMGPR